MVALLAPGKGAEKTHDGGVQPGAALKAFDATVIVGTHEHE